MKQFTFACILGLIGLLAAPLQVNAACADNNLVNQPGPIDGDGLRGIFRERLICGTSLVNSDQWQEEHRVTGLALIERALGPGHPVDPRHTVGSWGFYQFASPDATYPNGRWQVQYTYPPGGSNTFRFFVEDGGPPWNLCQTIGGAAEVSITSVNPIPPAGDDACGFY